jgi:hypothetical protein
MHHWHEDDDHRAPQGSDGQGFQGCSLGVILLLSAAVIFGTILYFVIPR